MPDKTPNEVVLESIQAQFPNEKLIAKTTKQGLMVLKVPTPKDIDDWIAGFKDSRRKAEDALALACTVYPVKEVAQGYFNNAPLMGTAMALFVKAEAVGESEEDKPDVQGFPSDLSDDQSIKMGQQAISQSVWQVHTEFGRVTLRLPRGIELDAWETSKLSPRLAAEALVVGCVLDPVPEMVRAWFLKRPLMGQWLSNKLRGWCVGEIEDYNSK